MLVENRDFFHTPAFDAPVRGSASEYFHNIWYGKSRMMWLPHGGKVTRRRRRQNAGVCVTDIRTDGQTDIFNEHSPHLCRASRDQNDTVLV